MTGEEKTAASEDAVNENEKPQTKWEDPGVPVGNAPPVSRGPLAFFAVAWVAFVIFLFVMMLSRYEAS